MFGLSDRANSAWLPLITKPNLLSLAGACSKQLRHSSMGKRVEFGYRRLSLPYGSVLCVHQWGLTKKDDRSPPASQASRC